ncbi:hypothetical protein BN1723_014958 [Verticillium longisporum]|uniref:Hydrophobin n=1 Tax=Verticillium longisporum TaxID=100787 RepID=A0A0G4MLT2_VERLO|nr:hypothetical protein BN1723_014958 [Verticillium longisporum]
MKSFTAIVTLFAGLAMATPATLDTRGSVCSGLYGNPQCCATDVLGVASLDCQNPKSANNANDFKHSCASTGKSAFCCTLPVAGQAVLCNKPVGV